MKRTGNIFTHRHTVKLTILLALGALSSLQDAGASVFINEVDYDQPGSDTAEFIELFNNGNANISLDGYDIDLINGSNSKVYRHIDLSGYSINSGAYFVVCNNPSQVANCNDNFTSKTGWIQNGAPDALALYDDNKLMIDALSYEGELSPFSEKTNAAVKDSNSVITSLSRLEDGYTGFNLGCITPGSANIAGSGNCSQPKISAVPVPAAMWLFGSGLIALLGTQNKLSRRKQTGY